LRRYCDGATEFTVYAGGSDIRAGEQPLFGRPFGAFDGIGFGRNAGIDVPLEHRRYYGNDSELA
jgi:hypothetical protein